MSNCRLRCKKNGALLRVYTKLTEVLQMNGAGELSTFRSYADRFTSEAAPAYQTKA